MTFALPKSLLRGVAWITLALLDGRASATNRYFSDEAATSNNGRFYLTAKSPDNELKEPPAFQSGFILTLTDTSTGNVLWTQPCPEGSASWIKVHDDSSVVVYTGNLVFAALEAVTGRVMASASIYELLPAEDFRNGRVAHSSAGPMWTQNALFGFFEHEGSTYFGCRTGWDRVFVLDFAGKRAVTDPMQAITRAFDDALRSRAADILAHAAAAPESIRGPHFYAFSNDVAMALDIAGRLELRDAIPAIRALEQVEPASDTVLETMKPESIGQETQIRPYRLRQWARTALRRLGETPRLLPVSYVVDDYWGPAKARIDLPADRDAAAISLPLVVTRRDLITQLGPPDALPDYRSTDTHWQYEIDGPQGTWILDVRFPENSDQGNWIRLKDIKPLLLSPDERAGDVF